MIQNKSKQKRNQRSIEKETEKDKTRGKDMKDRTTRKEKSIN